MKKQRHDDDFDLGPCKERAPDGSLRCTLGLGHVGWHCADGSSWFGSVWGFRQPAEPTVNAEPVTPVKAKKKTPPTPISKRIAAVVGPHLWVARAVVMSAPALGAIVCAAAGQFAYSFWLLLLAPISVVCAELIKNRPDPGDIHAEHQWEPYEEPRTPRRAEFLKTADFVTNSVGVTTRC